MQRTGWAVALICGVGSIGATMLFDAVALSPDGAGKPAHEPVGAGVERVDARVLALELDPILAVGLHVDGPPGHALDRNGDLQDPSPPRSTRVRDAGGAAVPEPATALLFAEGMLLAGLVARDRARRLQD